MVSGWVKDNMVSRFIAGVKPSMEHLGAEIAQYRVETRSLDRNHLKILGSNKITTN